MKHKNSEKRSGLAITFGFVIGSILCLIAAIILVFGQYEEIPHGDGLVSNGNVDMLACVRENETRFGYVIYWIKNSPDARRLPSSESDYWYSDEVYLVLSEYQNYEDMDPVIREFFPLRVYSFFEVTLPGDNSNYIELPDGRVIRLTTFC